MNIPKIEKSEIELLFIDSKITSNPELVELFNKTNINLEGFMQEFRKCVINHNFDGLLQLAYNNFEPKNQPGTFGGFDVISGLLQIMNVHISGEDLCSKAKNLGIKREQDIRVAKLNKILDATK